jgi:hypothetical protein
MAENNIDTFVTASGVEAVVRGDEESGRIRMLINHNTYEACVGDIVLAPFECRIIAL